MRFELVYAPPRGGFKHAYIAQWRGVTTEEAIEIKDWADDHDHHCFSSHGLTGTLLWAYPYDDEDAVLFRLRWG